MCIDNQNHVPFFHRSPLATAVQHSGKHTHTGLLRARGHTLGLAMSESRGITLHTESKMRHTAPSVYTPCCGTTCLTTEAAVAAWAQCVVCEFPPAPPPPRPAPCVPCALRALCPALVGLAAVQWHLS